MYEKPVITIESIQTNCHFFFRKYICEFLDQLLHTWPTQALEKHVTILQVHCLLKAFHDWPMYRTVTPWIDFTVSLPSHAKMYCLFLYRCIPESFLNFRLKWLKFILKCTKQCEKLLNVALGQSWVIFESFTLLLS